MAETVAIKYRAFLSYSHRDTPWGKWLHEALEGYRIDKDLVGRQTPAGPVPKTLRPIFRDREDFSAGHSLAEQTLSALESSQFLVVLCSPNAAQSKYVNEEIRRFKELGRADFVIPIIIDGEPGDPERECFPPALRFKLAPDGTLSEEREEPIAADARPQGDGKEIAKQKLVAGLLAVGFDEIARRAEQARKRRNRFWAALAGVFLMLAVLATSGFAWARYELGRNEELLDRTLKRATGLVDRAVAMSDQFGVPRSLSLGILQEAEGLFGDMAELGRQTTQMRYRKAEMLVAFARNYAVLGQTDIQRARVAEANRMMQALAAEQPANLEWQNGLALTYAELGSVAETQGSLEEALKNHLESLLIRERLSIADRSNALWLGNLATTLRLVGGIFVRLGRLDEALAKYQTAIPHARRLAASDPENGNWQIDLSFTYENFGDVRKAQRAFDDALKYYRESLAIRQQWAENDPKNVAWQSHLLMSHNKIGELQLIGHRYDQALESFRPGLAISERLAAVDPDNTVWRRSLAVAYDNVGEALHGKGLFEEATRNYRQGRAIFERLAARDPKNINWQHDLSASSQKLGDALASQRLFEEALKSYRDGLAIDERLGATDPGNTDWQRGLWMAHGRIGDLHSRQGKPEEALGSHRSGLAVIERLVAKDASNLTWQRDRSVTYDKIGNIELGRGALAEALRYYRQSLAVRMLLATAAPRSTEQQYDLAVSYDKLGEVLAAQGTREEAVKNYRSSLAILERLAAGDATNIGWQFDVIELNRALAVNGDDAARRFTLVAEKLRALQARVTLNAEQVGWLAEAEERLAKLTEAQAARP